MVKIFPEPEFIEKNYRVVYDIIGNNVVNLFSLQKELLKIPEQIKTSKIDFFEIMLLAHDIGFNLGQIDEKLSTASRKSDLVAKYLPDIIVYYDIDDVMPILKEIGEEIDKELLERFVRNVGREKARAILGW